MKGYWKDDKATSETIKNGWLHTGDLVEIDDDNYIRITGRKKEIIVFNKVDLLSKNEFRYKKMNFEETLNKKVVELSTLDKKLISKLKIKLLKNAS